MNPSDLTQEQRDIMLKLVLKMAALGVKASFNKIEPGPVITGYYFKPAANQPLKKIEAHEEDFALAAERESVTVQRSVGDVIIFVPNKDRQIIEYKDYLYWLIKNKDNLLFGEIPIPLGVDFLGNKRCLDLTIQPHILMAGSTNAGKSVFQSAVLCSLAVMKEPDELNIYLIDTKRLDLPLFRNMPHVMGVGDDIYGARQIFLDVLDLTRKRYQIFQQERVRNLIEYRQKTGLPIPYRLLIIDELADLLTLDKEYCNVMKDAEDKPKALKEILKELVAIARAAGTHIIAATQRPSVKIIDGDIKNNFPTRLALKVPSRFDSQTILGEGGAETLLGKGDMFIKRIDSSSLERYHGPFVKLDDIEQIVNNLDAVKQSLNFVR